MAIGKRKRYAASDLDTANLACVDAAPIGHLALGAISAAIWTATPPKIHPDNFSVSKNLMLTAYHRQDSRVGVMRAAADLTETDWQAQHHAACNPPPLAEQLAVYQQAPQDGRCNELIIPISQLYYGRKHWVTLHLQLSEPDGNNPQSILNATLYDSKSRFSLSRFYLTKQLQASLEHIDHTFSNKPIKSIFLGQQSFLNTYDCGAWTNANIEQLVKDGNIKKPRRARQLPCDKRNALNTVYEQATEYQYQNLWQRFKAWVQSMRTSSRKMQQPALPSMNSSTRINSAFGHEPSITRGENSVISFSSDLTEPSTNTRPARFSLLDRSQPKTRPPTDSASTTHSSFPSPL